VGKLWRCFSYKYCNLVFFPLNVLFLDCDELNVQEEILTMEDPRVVFVRAHCAWNFGTGDQPHCNAYRNKDEIFEVGSA